MSATINAFARGHAFDSPRSWAMAIIVLIHLGFFWALTHGLHRSIGILIPHTTQAVMIDEHQPPPERRAVVEPDVDSRPLVFDVPLPRTVDTEESTAVRVTSTTPVDPTPIARNEEPVRHVPVEVQPGIDPRRGLSEPLYPASLIREGVEGTVILSVQVLENGRVGDVRIERSSGHVRLDESAVREARRWKLIPGTRDGVPVVLWKQIPITFRIQNAKG